MVLDCRARLEKANHKLKELKRAGFLQTGVEQRLQSTDFLNANLRSIVTPQGMTWLKADTHELEAVKQQRDQALADSPSPSPSPHPHPNPSPSPHADPDLTLPGAGRCG